MVKASTAFAFVTLLAGFAGCVLENQALDPSSRSLDGGAGGAGGAGGIGSAGGIGGMGGSAGVGGGSTPRSRETCETCVNDSDCKEEDHRCVEMSYGSSRFPDEETGFCLKIAVPLSEGSPPEYDCATPYVTVLHNRSTLAGDDSESYCGIREDLTTCDAVLVYGDALDCSAAGSDICPRGGFCDWVRTEGEPWSQLCTHACDDASECQGPGGDNCNEHCGW